MYGDEAKRVSTVNEYVVAGGVQWYQADAGSLLPLWQVPLRPHCSAGCFSGVSGLLAYALLENQCASFTSWPLQSLVCCQASIRQGPELSVCEAAYCTLVDVGLPWGR